MFALLTPMDVIWANEHWDAEVMTQQDNMDVMMDRRVVGVCVFLATETHLQK